MRKSNEWMNDRFDDGGCGDQVGMLDGWCRNACRTRDVSFRKNIRRATVKRSISDSMGMFRNHYSKLFRSTFLVSRFFPFPEYGQGQLDWTEIGILCESY